MGLVWLLRIKVLYWPLLLVDLSNNWIIQGMFTLIELELGIFKIRVSVTFVPECVMKMCTTTLLLPSIKYPVSSSHVELYSPYCDVKLFCGIV